MTFQLRAGAALGLGVVVLLVGCRDDQQPPVDQRGADSASGSGPAATDAAPRTQPSSQPIAATAPQAGDGAASGGDLLAIPDVPPPKFVEQRVQRDFYQDRTPKIVRHVNVYSDDSQISNGQYVENHPNGQVFCQGNYRAGKRDGDWQYWHQNGQPAKTVTYRNGQLDGQWEVLREGGTKAAVRCFRSGQRDGTWQSFDATGTKVVAQEEYQSGIRTGTWATWYPSGAKRLEQHYKNGQLDGQQVAWHENGQLALESSYRNGQRHGKLTRWDAAGSKLQEVEYRDGALVAPRQSDSAPAAESAAGGNDGSS